MIACKIILIIMTLSFCTQCQHRTVTNKRTQGHGAAGNKKPVESPAGNKKSAPLPGTPKEEEKPVEKVSPGPGDWQEVNPGIWHLHKTSNGRPNRIHIVKIDLTNPTNKVFATRVEDKKSTVSAFAKKYNCKVAINGDFFDYNGYKVSGLAVGEGLVWPDSADNDWMGFLAVGQDGKAIISMPEEVKGYEGWMWSVVSGMPAVVKASQGYDTPCTLHFCQRHPRSAVGLGHGGKMLIIASIDGRSSSSKGATTFEFGQVLAENGMEAGINLDGGGSTALYLAAKGGVVNKPSDGKERVVANHLGVCDGRN